MKLLVMTAPTFFVEEDKILSRLSEAGLEYLHLRKPNAPRELLERLLKLLPSQVLESTIIHGNSQLKADYQLAGVNIDTSAPNPSWWKRGKVTRTCSQLEKLRAAKERVDWVLLDGVAGRTINPTMPPFTDSELEKAAQSGLINKRVYALGDIRPDNIRHVLSFGFGGVVLSQSLWRSFEIHRAADFSAVTQFYEQCLKEM